VIMGEMSPAELQSRLERHPAWPRVSYLGLRPRAEATHLLMTAHAGLVLFHPAPNHTEAQPNKLFEYMAAGLPVIASDFPLWHDLIVGEGCGLVVDPLDSAAIARAMIAVTGDATRAAAMGHRGQAAVHARLNWAVEGARLVRFYSRLAGEHDHPII
jgi:glycosyltransferase involved in cell wall biosynthesis